MSSMPPGHARGHSGEQHMGFFLGERVTSLSKGRVVPVAMG
jgi:hypothetical protein